MKSSTCNFDDASELEKNLVRGFFGKVKVIYGEARFKSAWPNADAIREAMREWGPDILRHDQMSLQRKLKAVKKLMGSDERYRYPDISAILSVGQQPGAGGIAAQSYRSSSDVLSLPPAPTDKTAGNEALSALKAEIEEALRAEAEAAQKRFEEGREELRRLVDKHLPAGCYVNTCQAETGIDTATTKIQHPYRSLAKGEHYLND